MLSYLLIPLVILSSQSFKVLTKHYTVSGHLKTRLDVFVAIRRFVARIIISPILTELFLH